MPVHIFLVDKKNFQICINKGVAGIGIANSVSEKNRPNINNQLIARMASIKENDRILFYITKHKEIHGIYQALGKPFYDETIIWDSEDTTNNIYPFRIRINNSDTEKFGHLD